MQDAKDPKRESNETAGGGTASRDPDATSSETLSDMEEKEKVANTGETDRPSTSTPSPGGSFDDERGGRDDAGPM